MWVISIDASSTTTAKWYSGVPSLRTITKSPPMLAVSISTSPRTRSCQVTTPACTRKRSTRPLARGLARRAFLGGEICASTDVSRRLVGGLLRLPVSVELLGGAIARVREIPRREVCRGFHVARGPLHLPVRRERSPVPATGAVGSLVPADPQPVEVLQDVRLERERVASEIGVLEPEDERAARSARVEVVEERRPRGPDVQGSGGARRDPDAGCWHHRSLPDNRCLAGSRLRSLDAASATWTRWKSVGSASPGRTSTSAAGRRPSVARPERAVEREGVERLRAGEDVDVGAGPEAARLEVREQPGVLLGRLRDPVDRRPLAGLGRRRAACRRAAASPSRRRAGCRAGTSRGGRAARPAAPRRAARSPPAVAPPRRPIPPSQARRPR